MDKKKKSYIEGNISIVSLSLEEYKEILDTNNINPNTFKDVLFGLTQLQYATYEGNLDIVKYLVLDRGCDVNKGDFTPLMRAIQGMQYKDNYSTIKFLIDNGADITKGYVSKYSDKYITPKNLYEFHKNKNVKQSGDISKLLCLK